MHDVGVALDDEGLVEPNARRGLATRPRSFRPRSTSMTCSARSLTSASSSASSRASSAGSAPRGRVPAMGRTSGPPVLHPHHHLGARAHQHLLAHGEVEEVGARVERPKRPVDGEGVHACRRVLALEDLGERRSGSPRPRGWPRGPSPPSSRTRFAGHHRAASPPARAPRRERMPFRAGSTRSIGEDVARSPRTRSS